MHILHQADHMYQASCARHCVSLFVCDKGLCWNMLATHMHPDLAEAQHAATGRLQACALCITYPNLGNTEVKNKTNVLTLMERRDSKCKKLYVECNLVMITGVIHYTHLPTIEHTTPTAQ